MLIQQSDQCQGEIWERKRVVFSRDAAGSKGVLVLLLTIMSLAGVSFDRNQTQYLLYDGLSDGNGLRVEIRAN